jgi:predicted phage terminase large subunit-like protein
MAVEYVKPMRDKAARLMEHQAKFESGLVSFNPDPSKGCAVLMDQVKNFPSVAHDDLVDAMVYSLGALESGGKMVLIPQA